MRFNINGEVRVKLTEFGFNMHRQNHDQLFEFWPPGRKPRYLRPEVDKDGWSSFQMWSLMREFGQYIRMGGDQPFELEIEIPDNQR